MINKKVVKLLSSLAAYFILMFGLGCDQHVFNGLFDLQNNLISTISFVLPIL